MPSNVLVVGSGPVGLTVAIQLARFGIQTDIIDQATMSVSYSKALSVSAASLKAFHGLGLQDVFRTAGKAVKEIEVAYNGKRVARINNSYLPEPYRYYLSIPQPETERILREEAARLGCNVHGGLKLVGLSQSEQSVAADLERVDTGEVDRRQYEYVVGCDGAQSTTRQLLNIRFDGFDYEDHFIMGDVIFSSPPDRDYSSYYILDDGFLIFLPMNDGLFRLVVSRPGSLPSQRPLPNQEELQFHLDRFVSPKLHIEAVTWASSARFFNRLASTNHIGRVFLAGDSYHLFSPIGGQGMNTGIQDAMNLAWKLAYAVKGHGGNKLLATYRAERYQSVKKVATITGNYTEAILGRTEPSGIRSVYSPVMRNRYELRNILPLQFSGFLYDHSEGLDCPVGRHVPFAEFAFPFLGIRDTYEIPLTGRNILFVSPFCDWNMSAILAEFSEVLYVRHLSPTVDANVVDALNLRNPNVCLVRPDGYIGFYGSPDQLPDYLGVFRSQS
ncbi:FAD-dependent monooxygenase [Methylobacterium radiotolerans]|uniref:FAD-dependent monooxygenase n=1 Tax=Methylobacterium radiotolerans TaxID=31998 RepID=UPI00097673E8|nr:FAD-dependent monooxygenase [Methylobacterium radiotolerans]